MIDTANILVVEDERIVALDIQAILQRAGYRVVGAAASGEAAVTEASHTDPDLILMDIVLEGEMDGIEAARRIRERREVPVVYLTANGDRAVLDRAKATEPIAYILKPFDGHELLTTVEIALHQYRVAKRRSREKQEAAEARYRELFDTTLDGIAITDLDGYHLDCNMAYLKLLGYGSAATLRRLTNLRVTAPEFREEELRLIREQTLHRGYSDEYEKDCLRRDESRVAVSSRIWLRRDERGKPTGLWFVLRDITERREAQHRLLDYQRQLQSLMEEISLVEERERERIATDIHDRISQNLAACQIRLQRLARSLAGGAEAQELEAVAGLLESTLGDTSSLVFELCPPVLQQFGLAAAVECFTERIAHQHGLKVTVSTSGHGAELPGDQRKALFRMAGELLNNVVKHAHATEAAVAVENLHDSVRVTVEDNGIGFCAHHAPANRRGHGGFGLLHIRERMRGWHGTFEIQSIGHGTRAQLIMPRRGAGNSSHDQHKSSIGR